MQEKTKTQKGFIQIPILIVVIISLVVAGGVGTGVVLHKQGKLAPLVANISEVFKGTEEPITIEHEELSEEPLIEELPIETPDIKATERLQKLYQEQVAAEQEQVEKRLKELKEKFEEKEKEVEAAKIPPEELGIPIEETPQKIQKEQEEVVEETPQKIQKEQEEVVEELDGTEVQRFIASNTIWPLKDSPFIVTDDVLIKKGVTLTIEPGVVVKFQKGQGRINTGGFAILNEGNIVANGTPNNRIIFSSLRPNPQLGDWGTIETINGGSINFNYVEIKYASLGICLENASGAIITHSYFHNNGTAIHVNKGPAIISNNLIEENYAGISFLHIPYSGPFDDRSFRYQGAPEIKITNNTIRNNIGQSFNEYHAGIHIELNAFHYSLIISQNNIYNNSHGINFRETGGFDPSIYKLPTIKQNNIYDNKGYAVQFAGERGIEIDMSDNWWGTTDVKRIGDLIYDYYDSWRPGIINYQPIATSEIPNAGMK